MPVYSPLTTSILLDGVDERVDWGNIAPVMTPERTDPFSWVIWMQSTAVGQEILWSKIRGSAGWQLNMNVAVVGDFRMIGPRASTQSLLVTSVQAGGAPTINDGAWHMIGATSAGNSPLTPADIEIYIDDNHLTGGERSGSGSVTNTTIFAGSTLIAGSRFGSVNFYPGNLLHCAGWNIELTPTQMIDEVFGNGQPQDLFSTSFANPVFWDTLGDGDAIGAGNMIDLVAANNGTFINGEVGDFVLDVPAAGEQGTAITHYGKGGGLTRPTLAQVIGFGRGGVRTG